MYTQFKPINFLFYTFTLFVCLNSFFLRNTPAQVGESASENYTFETIEVPGVDFLALTASVDDTRFPTDPATRHCKVGWKKPTEWFSVGFHPLGV